VDIAHTANIGTMLLTHLVPSPDNNVLESMFFSNIIIPTGFGSDVVIGEDGMIVQIKEDGDIIFLKSASVTKIPITTIFCILVLVSSFIF